MRFHLNRLLESMLIECRFCSYNSILFDSYLAMALLTINSKARSCWHDSPSPLLFSSTHLEFHVQICFNSRFELIGGRLSQ